MKLERWLKPDRCLTLLALAVTLAIADAHGAPAEPAAAADPAGADPVASPMAPGPDSGAKAPLSAREVAVVANFSFPGSVELAKHYMQGRGIPEAQLLVTGMPEAEGVARRQYEELIAGPIKDFLVDEKLEHVRCVVLMHGVPLIVAAPQVSPDAHRLEVMIKDERDHFLQSLIEQVEKANQLAAPGSAKPTPLPPLKASGSANDYLGQLRGQLIEALKRAAERLKAEPAARSQGAGERGADLELLLAVTRDALGFVPLSALGLDQFGFPEISDDRKIGYARRVRELLERDLDVKSLRELVDLLAESRGSAGVIEATGGLLDHVKPGWTHQASVDSELCTLFWPPFPLRGPVNNPLNSRVQIQDAPRTLMVCRIDGPGEAVVRRIIDTSLEVEKKGLEGTAYLDARYPYDPRSTSPYGRFDAHLHRLSKLMQAMTQMTVKLNEGGELFQAGQAPGAALYCGWYSMGKYVDAFDFVPGAVGYHIASAEAVTLRNPKSQVWCPRLLADGVVATMGPVAEPYLNAFPLPDEFFSLLLSGDYPLANCYFLTVPSLSWMMTLVGDPLYRPFAAKPQLTLDDLGEYTIDAELAE